MIMNGSKQEELRNLLGTFQSPLSNQYPTLPKGHSPETDSVSIVINVGAGKEEVIDVKRGDDPDLLASLFCVKYGLTEKQRANLSKLIKKNMDEIGNSVETSPSKGAGVVCPSSHRLPEQSLSAHHQFDQWQRQMEHELISRRKSENQPKINERSSKIAASKTQSTVPVHERLHKQALQRQARKQKEELNKSVMIERQKTVDHHRSNSNRSFVSESLNFGERLYERERRKKEDLLTQWRTVRADRERKEMRQATFKPKINSRSQSLALRRSQSRTEDRLIENGHALQEKKEYQRNISLFEKQQQCTFKPLLNKQTIQISLDKSQIQLSQENQRTKHEQLFVDAKRRQNVIQKNQTSCHDNECTFKPNLRLTQDYPLSDINNRPFFERFEHKNIDQINIDVKPLPHRPITGRQPLVDRNVAGLPIGDYLYSQGRVQAEVLQEKKQKETTRIERERTASYIKDGSRKMVEQMKLSSFNRLFDLLDSNEDGLITAKDVEITLIPTEVLKLITPILCEMEEEEQVLRRPEFIQILNEFYTVLSIPEKKILYSLNNRPSQSQILSTNFSFHPKILGYSRELAQKTRYQGEDLGTRAIAEYRARLLKLEERKRFRENEELRKCTFYPKLSTSFSK